MTKDGLLKKVKVESSAARNRYPDVSSIELTDELKSLKTASKAYGLSFAHCWLNADVVGVRASRSKKSNNSFLVTESNHMCMKIN
jgi:hypothetical protein